MVAVAILENLKITISRPRFIRFWRNLARWRSSTFLTCPTVKNFKIQDGGGCRFLNPKIAISQPRFDLTQWRSSMLLTVLIVKNLATAILKKLKSIYRLTTGNSHAIWDHTVYCYMPHGSGENPAFTFTWKQRDECSVEEVYYWQRTSDTSHTCHFNNIDTMRWHVNNVIF